MPNAHERMQILLRLERGEISTAQAEQLLNGVPDTAPERSPQGSRPAQSRMEILEQVERGQLSADQATQRLLQQHAPAAKAGDQQHSSFDEEYVNFSPIQGKGLLSQVLFIGGLVVTIGSAVWMNSLLQNSGMNFWFFCLWLPFALGLAALVLGFSARNGEWMQLSVRSRKPGQRKVFISLPVPLAFLEGVIRRSEAWIHINRDEPPAAPTEQG